MSVAEVVSSDKQEKSKATELPKPTGYHILVAIPEREETTEGGVYKPDNVVDQEQTATIVGFVLSLGPDCYNDKKRFPSGPWCKEGDFVLFRAFSGTRIKIHGKEFRLVNDDTVEAVVDDPRGYERA